MTVTPHRTKDANTVMSNVVSSKTGRSYPRVRHRGRARGLRLITAAVATTFAGCSSETAPPEDAKAPLQLGYSFSEAAGSAVDFRKADVSPARECSALRQMTDANVTVIRAETVPAADGLPEYCRIDGLIASEVKFFLALPTQWNGRFYMPGNGGFAGEPVAYHMWAINQGLQNNFAVARTNTGHDWSTGTQYESENASFGYNNLSAEIDYAYRAVHLTNVTAKKLIDDYYGQGPNYSYWNGCSTGGRQGMMSAQRFPEDFDGIVAGMPVADFVGHFVLFNWNLRPLQNVSLPIEKITGPLRETIFEMCDGIDGLEDGLITDPRQCTFDPKVHLPVCANGEDGADCFTSNQIDALAHMYSDVMSNGASYFPGLPVGGEVPVKGVMADFENTGPGWQNWLVGADGGPGFVNVGLTEGFFKYLAFDKDNPDYDWSTFDFDNDIEKLNGAKELLNATDPDLSRFRDLGGKLISYHGWADMSLMAERSVMYFDEVEETLGEDPRDFFRLFLMPGVHHCVGGYGPDDFDPMTAIINWVEGQTPPNRLIAKQAEDENIIRTRPLCVYPKTATYNGSGDIDDASSFACSAE